MINTIHVFLGYNNRWAVKFGERKKVYRYFYYEDDAIQHACLYAVEHKIPMVLLHDDTGCVYKEIRLWDVL